MNAYSLAVFFNGFQVFALAPPLIESRKSYQAVNPYYVWTWWVFPSFYGNEGKFGGNEGTLDGNLHYLGDLNTETVVTFLAVKVFFKETPFDGEFFSDLGDEECSHTGTDAV